MPYLTLRNISKRWGTKTALDNITLDVAEGDFVAVLGPSGCGKTTLLRIVAGLESPDSGTVAIRQRDITRLLPSQRQLSMVFQSYALFPHLSVRENLLFGLRARGEDKRGFAARLAEVGKLMELEPLLDRLPAQLSGGQQQRVALGRAVIAKHTFCLMDEPLSNLDAKLRQSMRREIRALQQKLGLTMLYVTHDQTEAMSMADRIILLNDGRIAQYDVADALYNDPADIFTAQFIGAPAMNIFPPGYPDTPLPAGISPQSATPADTVLGVRAEDIALTAPDSGNITCRVMTQEYMGAYTLISCSFPGPPGQITVKAAGMPRCRQGDRVGLAWPAAAEYLFSAATGERLPDAERRRRQPEHWGRPMMR